VEPDLLIENAAIHIFSGHISSIETWKNRPSVSDIEVVDWGSAVIMPGLVNAHTHLELTIAHNQIEMRNNGKLPYKEIQLRISYFDNAGKILAVRTHSIAGTIVPGSTLKFADIGIDNIPESTTGFRISIACADIGFVHSLGITQAWT
jgi:hypothetical protein